MTILVLSERQTDAILAALDNAEHELAGLPTMKDVVQTLKEFREQMETAALEV